MESLAENFCKELKILLDKYNASIFIEDNHMIATSINECCRFVDLKTDTDDVDWDDLEVEI